MKAMVLAAGLGSRLGPLTQALPKCLVDIGGITILEHVVRNLKRAGVDSLVINLYHLGDIVRDFVEKHDGFGLPVEFSREDVLLGTGGGLWKVEPLFRNEREFIVHNSDVYTDLDLRGMVAFHREKRAVGTLAVIQRETKRYLLFDMEGCLAGWRNLGTGQERVLRGGPLQPLAFSGIQVLSPRIFEFMQDEEGAFSLTRPYLKAAEALAPIYSYRMDSSEWMDMGTPERLSSLREKLTALGTAVPPTAA